VSTPPSRRRLGAILCALASSGGFARPSRASELENARAYCARVNAHWVGGAQQCACNAGYTESGNTCVSAGSGNAGATGGGFAIPPGALTGAAASLIGGALGSAFVTPLSNQYQGHKPVQAVVGDEDESAPNPNIDAGMGAANDILKDYHGAIDDGAVRITGETPALLRAAEQPPLISVAVGDIEDISLPPETAEAPSDWAQVSLQMLKEWGSMASDDAKAVISKAAALEKDFSDSATGDAVSAASTAHDTMELLNLHSMDRPLSDAAEAGAEADATHELSETLGTSGKVLQGIDIASKGTRLVDACANGGTGACEGAAWGVGLSYTGAGTTMTIGMGLGKSGRNSLNAGYRKLNDEMRALETAAGKTPQGDNLGTLPSQKSFNNNAGSLFDMF
jgi:hypothetical protein